MQTLKKSEGFMLFKDFQQFSFSFGIEHMVNTFNYRQNTAGSWILDFNVTISKYAIPHAAKQTLKQKQIKEIIIEVSPLWTRRLNIDIIEKRRCIWTKL